MIMSVLTFNNLCCQLGGATSSAARGPSWIMSLCTATSWLYLFNCYLVCCRCSLWWSCCIVSDGGAGREAILLVHGQVTIIFVVSVCLSVCLCWICGHSQSQLHTPGTHYRLTLDIVTLCTPLKTHQNTPVQTVLT